MRIVFIITNLHDANMTGQQKIALGLAEKLSEAGHDVLIVGNSEKDSTNSLIKSNDRMQYHIIDGKASIWSKTTLSFLSPRMLQTIRKFEPDIIHGHGSLTTWFSSWFKIALKKPAIQTLYDSDLLFGSTRTIAQLPLRFVNHVVCTSDYLASKLPTTTTCTVQPYGIEDIWFETKQTPKQKDLTEILFWGDAAPGRGIEVRFDAIPQICNGIPNVKISLALRYTYPDYNYQLDYICSHYPVSVVSTIPGAHISSLLESTDLVVLPYTRTTIQPPLTLLESMAAGKPVITTCVDANTEIVGENGAAMLIDPNNSIQLIDAVNALILDSTLRINIGKKARTRANEIAHWRVAIPKILDVYQRHLSKNVTLQQ